MSKYVDNYSLLVGAHIGLKAKELNQVVQDFKYYGYGKERIQELVGYLYDGDDVLDALKKLHREEHGRCCQ